MTLTPSVVCPTTATYYAYARLIAEEVVAAHNAAPFADVDAVSSWLHRTYGNPRLKVVTNEAGSTITITYGVERFLNINCR